MDRALEAFEQAERARILGDDDSAIEHYREALDLAEQSSQLELWRVHHMLGVSLTNNGQYGLANGYFMMALDKAPSRSIPSITRDLSRCNLLRGDLHAAMSRIYDAIQATPIIELAERGASIGFRARIKLAQRKPHEALEDFGLADSLLQRGDNRHYELYNLLHFLEALLDNGDWAYAHKQIERAEHLAEGYGSHPVNARLELIKQRISVYYELAICAEQ